MATSPAPRPPIQSFFITIPKGLESALEKDLKPLGLPPLTLERGGYRMTGSLADAYKVCLHSRVAGRVLMPIKSFEASTPEKLYGGVKSIRWSDHLTPNETIAIDFQSSLSEIQHTQFGAQKTKDAICDQLRSVQGERPSVNLISPDIRINVYVHQNQATVSIDLSGESLHMRGYRENGSMAPLKENLAAGMLLLLGWQEMCDSADRPLALFDPMCGSGTLVIEAAMIAGRIAPGNLRRKFGFTRWKQHDEALWQRLREEAVANERPIEGMRFWGFDVEPRSIRAAQENWGRTGLQAPVHFERKRFPASVELQPDWGPKGLFIVNPPYGERLGDVTELSPLYESIGDVMKKRFPGWKAGVLTAHPEHLHAIALKPARRIPLFNGPIECRLAAYELYSGSLRNSTTA